MATASGSFIHPLDLFLQEHKGHVAAQLVVCLHLCTC